MQPYPFAALLMQALFTGTVNSWSYLSTRPEPVLLFQAVPEPAVFFISAAEERYHPEVLFETTVAGVFLHSLGTLYLTIFRS